MFLSYSPFPAVFFLGLNYFWGAGLLSGITVKELLSAFSAFKGVRCLLVWIWSLVGCKFFSLFVYIFDAHGNSNKFKKSIINKNLLITHTICSYFYHTNMIRFRIWRYDLCSEMCFNHQNVVYKLYFDIRSFLLCFNDYRILWWCFIDTDDSYISW